MNRKNSHFDQLWIRTFSAVILLIFIFFAGCSGEAIFDTIFPTNSDSSTSEIDETSTELTTEDATISVEQTTPIQPTPEVTQEFTIEQNELVVWVPEEFSILVDTEASAILQQRIEEFERQNPGIVVVVRVKASSGSGGILDSLRNTKVAATNALPQIALLSRTDMEDAVEQGLLLPVEEYFHDSNPSTYFSYAYEISQLDGIVYGFPFAGDALVGIASADFSNLEFTSWDDIRAKKIPLYFAANSPQAIFFISQYQSTNGLLVDEQGHASFTSENLMIVLDSFDQNAQKQIFQENFSTLNTNEDVWALLQNGDVKWEINWYSKALQSTISGLQVFQIPSLGSEPYVLAKGWLWTIVNTDTEVAEIVPEFIAFFSDPQFLASFSQAAGYLPVLPTSLALYENGDSFESLNAILTAAHALPENGLIVELGPVFRDATLMVLSQDYSLQEIIETTQRQIEALQTK
jgi:ABC-type glycerol-3-phosphate transport system substrate-binding protein